MTCNEVISPLVLHTHRGELYPRMQQAIAINKHVRLFYLRSFFLNFFVEKLAVKEKLERSSVFFPPHNVNTTQLLSHRLLPTSDNYQS